MQTMLAVPEERIILQSVSVSTHKVSRGTGKLGKPAKGYRNMNYLIPYDPKPTLLTLQEYLSCAAQLRDQLSRDLGLTSLKTKVGHARCTCVTLKAFDTWSKKDISQEILLIYYPDEHRCIRDRQSLARKSGRGSIKGLLSRVTGRSLQ